jgi:AcrR family transcriptional regulator
VRKKRGAYHHGQLRTAIVDDALAIVATDGVRRLSLRDVARRLGVSHQAPYRHFADKRALLDAIARDGFAMLTAALVAPTEHAGDPTARLIELGSVYVEFARSHTAHYRVMFAEVDTESGSPPPEDETSSAFHQLASAIAEGQRQRVFVSGPARDVALASFAFVHGLAMLVVDGKLGDISAGAIEKLIERHVVGTVRR